MRSNNQTSRRTKLRYIRAISRGRRLKFPGAPCLGTFILQLGNTGNCDPEFQPVVPHKGATRCQSILANLRIGYIDVTYNCRMIPIIDLLPNCVQRHSQLTYETRITFLNILCSSQQSFLEL